MEQRKLEVLLAVQWAVLPEGRPGEQHRPEAVLLEERPGEKQEGQRRPVEGLHRLVLLEQNLLLV